MPQASPTDPSATLTRQLAVALLDRSRVPLPSQARHQAAVLLADFLACARAGLHHPGSRTPARAAGRVGKAPADHPGTRPRTGTGVGDWGPMLAAAAHAGDRDDVHWGAVTHPGSVVWPVVLNLGAETGATGRALLGAASAGYQACVGVASFLGPGHAKWFHSTATAGTVGAAAAAGILLDLDEPALADALGHALSAMGGSAQCLDERSGTRLFHRSHAVRTGIAAAKAAAGGLAATRLGFEGARGLLGGPEQSEREPDALLGGGPSAIGATSVRLHATSGWNQAAVQAAAAQPRRAGQRAWPVTVHVHPAVAAASTGATAGPGERWWSLEWSVAAALLTGDPQTSPEEPLGDQERRRRLAEELVVVRDQPSVLSASVVVATNDGPSTTTVERPWGHSDSPASSEQLQAKWRRIQPAGEWAAVERLESLCAEALEAAVPVAARLGDVLASRQP
jgi:2-methylcitrate dehydratase PrpD